MPASPAVIRVIHVLVLVATLTSLLTSSNAPHRVAADRLSSAALSDAGPIEIQAADPGNPRTLYRTRATAAGDIVERSTDSGATWTRVLTSTPTQPIPGPRSGAARPAPACRPAGYTHIRSLVVTGSGAGTLYVGTSGTPGNYLDRGCSSAVGGLYALVGSGVATLLGSAGLPYAQDPAGRTVPTYDIDSVTPDPLSPGVIYVHAAHGTGPGSPPAGLYKTNDNGAHWTEIDAGLRPSTTITNAAGVVVPVYNVGTLSINQSNPQLLTFTNDTGSYQSNDAGETWLSPGQAAVVVPSSTPTAPPTPTAAPTVVGQVQFRAQAASVAALPAGWAWSQLSPVSALPPGRQDAVTVWDPTDKVVLVFGGSDTTETKPLNDLWAYSLSSNTWTARATGPSSRFGAAAAWDSADNVMLVFGGQTGSGIGARYTGDLWAYRPSTNTWTLLTASGAAGAPVPRSHAVAVWDGSGNRLLVFGGEVSESPFQGLNDVWSFTPSGGGTSGSWLQLNANNSACTVTCPMPRYASEGAWDSGNGMMTIFGGQNSTQSVLSDTWTWTPAGVSGVWTNVNSVNQPAGRAESSGTYDSTHGVFVVGPGLSLANGNVSDVWAYRPGQGGWQQLPVAASPTPPSRHLAQWVWDDADGVFILFGGRVAGTQGGNDLWELAPSGPVPTPTVRPSLPITAGFDEGWAVDNNQNVVVTPAQLAATTNVGAKTVRINFRLGSATDWTNAALLAAYDTVVNNYLAAGIQVEGLITNEAAHGSQADWTANNREVAGGNGDNTYITTAYVQNAVKPLLAHFAERVKLWELWNEPNAYQSCSGAVCTGGSFIYPSNFAALLVDSYVAIKDPAPIGLGLSDVTIISGGIFGHSIGGALTSTNAGATYLKNAFTMGITTIGIWATFAAAHGGHYPLDAIGQHLYVDQNLLTTTTDLAGYFGWLRGAVSSFETPQPTYLTEGAWSTANVPQNIQALNLDLLFGAGRFVGYVPDLVWFELQDVPQNNLYFGLTDSSLTAKESYSHYQAQNASPGPSATPTTMPTATSTATLPAGSGTLVGSSALAPASVNLTNEGTADWAHWGLISATTFDHKASGSGELSTYAVVNGGTVGRTTVSSLFSWSDGTPDGSNAGTGIGASISSVGHGFALSVPAGPTVRTLHLYVGVYRARAAFSAALSGGSAPTYSDGSLNNSSGISVEEYTLRYSAATVGQMLRISFTVAANYGFGNVSLEAATLDGGGAGATATATPTATDTTTPTSTSTAVGAPTTSTATATSAGTGTSTNTRTATPVPATNTSTATIAAGSGSLDGSAAAAPSAVNLTNEGTADWAHWGLISATTFDHKASGSGELSTYAVVNGGTVGRTTVPTLFSWSDGTPDGSNAGTGIGASVSSVGHGFALSVPADPTVRTLHLYVGVYRAKAAFSATLSDGSAPAYSDGSLDNSSGISVEEYTLRYSAATAGQTLHISFTVAANYGFGNVSLEAATLSGDGGASATATPAATATSMLTSTRTATPISPTNTNTPTIAAGTGSLDGSAAVAPSAVNLTSEGTADWAHWGLISATTFDHNAGGSGELSTYAVVNGGTVGRTTVSSLFSWSDGTPDGSNAGTGIGASISSVGHGFALSVPADPTVRTLHLYVGVYRARAAFSARLSDGSAPAYSDGSLNNSSGISVEEYTLRYSAATAGQTLQISFTVAANYGFGNVSLEAATLS